MFGSKNKKEQILITIKQTETTSIDPPQNAVLNTLYMILHGYGIPVSFLKPFVYPQIQEHKLFFIKTTNTIQYNAYHKKLIININNDLLSPYTWSIGIGKRELVKKTLSEIRLKTISLRHGEELSKAIIDFTSIINDYNKLLYIIGEIPTRNTYDVLTQGLKQWSPEWGNARKTQTIPTRQDIYNFLEKLEYDETIIYIDGREISDIGEQKKPETEFLAIITDKKLITLMYICNLPRKLVMTEPLLLKETGEQVKPLLNINVTGDREEKNAGDKTD